MLIIINQSKVRVPRKFLEKHWQLLVKDLRLGSSELTLVFLDAGPAKKMNLQFRGKNYATDVLSFESPQDVSRQTLGELVLCPQVLKKQAHDHALSYQQELLYMMIHGVLHLLGHDHERSEAEAEEMFQIQDLLFDRYLRR